MMRGSGATSTRSFRAARPKRRDDGHPRQLVVGGERLTGAGVSTFSALQRFLLAKRRPAPYRRQSGRLPMGRCSCPTSCIASSTCSPSAIAWIAISVVAHQCGIWYGPRSSGARHGPAEPPLLAFSLLVVVVVEAEHPYRGPVAVPVIVVVCALVVGVACASFKLR